MMKRRVVDAAGTGDGVRVLLNDKELPVRSFEDFVRLHFPRPAAAPTPPSTEEPAPTASHEPVYVRLNKHWEVAVGVHPANEEETWGHVSFVNGMRTSRGGTHVQAVLEPLVRRATELLQRKHKELTIAPALVRSKLLVFVNANLAAPSFDSQAKEQLVTDPADFRPALPDLPERVVRQLVDSGLEEAVVASARAKELSVRAKPENS